MKVYVTSYPCSFEEKPFFCDEKDVLNAPSLKDRFTDLTFDSGSLYGDYIPMGFLKSGTHVVGLVRIQDWDYSEDGMRKRCLEKMNMNQRKDWRAYTKVATSISAG